MENRQRPYPHYKFPDEINIICRPCEDCNWYGLKPNSYIFTCENYGWFPTNVIMGVCGGRFFDSNGIGAQISGTLGTASIGVLDAIKAADILRNAGYNVKMNY